jgi:cytochrome o ubiquinol oxidase subunit 1
LPKNSAFGAIVGAFAFAFGFAMVWHIWWAAIASALVIAAAVIVRSSEDEAEYCLPAAEVEKIEDQRYQDIARARRLGQAESSTHVPAAPLQGSLP